MMGEDNLLIFLAGLFSYVILGGIWIVLIGAYLVLLMEWRSLKKQSDYESKTQPSEDFMIEKDRVLEQIGKRIAEAGVCSIFLKEELKDFENLKDSSEVASLFRFAHFGGCHLTFEQDECEWKCDSEYYKTNVFKTDLGEASALREERKWSHYKRYYDPSRSRRERALGR